MISDAIRLYGARGHYLRGMTDAALSERLVHWMNNCTQLSQAGMVNLCATENPDYFQRLVDVMAETTLRHGDSSDAQHREMWAPDRNVMIKPNHLTTLKIAQIQRLLSERESPVLLRFGTSKFMRELYETGGLLFQEASTFKNSENLSVKDDELTLLMKRYIPKDELKGIPGAPDPAMIAGHGAGMNFSLSCPDFLVLCMTDAVNFRMISDWDAGAVVIIHNPEEFTKRLKQATERLTQMVGAVGLEHGNVIYVDPYFPLNRPDVPFCKHYKFAYQREFRFIVRGGGKADFEHRKIEVGSIKDIASLVEFNL